MGKYGQLMPDSLNVQQIMTSGISACAVNPEFMDEIHSMDLK